MACLGGSRPPPFYYEIWSTRSHGYVPCGASAKLRPVSAEARLRGLAREAAEIDSFFAHNRCHYSLDLSQGAF
eukprot:588734-Pyramimonas_sp.AAC.1